MKRGNRGENFPSFGCSFLTKGKENEGELFTLIPLQSPLLFHPNLGWNEGKMNKKISLKENYQIIPYIKLIQNSNFNFLS